ncbi:2OG-Fe(II) oxygenase superfamily-domain-containing protein [Aspergillus pseudoustus]|uniref:2OG-Fe(II) oxygenase superfamily-domain-containing protein n=1 Tax=Aspergillus pseudoustus TaxID=1810923 RepID=A0ABR4KQH8_9EURO
MPRRGTATPIKKVKAAGARKTRTAAKAANTKARALMAVETEDAADGDADEMDIDVQDTNPPQSDGEPDVDGEPPAWAKFRTPLGDALPWFRKFQGGMYTRDGVLYGMLISADAGVRSFIDDEIIITRTGGSSERDAEGNLTQTADQKTDKGLAKAVYNSCNYGISVGKNKVLKRKLPRPFNVMDYFRVSYVWHEKIDDHVAVRIRLEKVDLEKKSWWAVKGSSSPPSNAERVWVNPTQHRCATCGVKSPWIYTIGWICVNKACATFWTLPNGAAPPSDLTYDPKFLAFRHPPGVGVLSEPHYSLIPDCMSVIPDGDPHSTFTRKAWKMGVVCPKCRQCLSRRYWDGWRCDETCGFERRLQMHPLSLRAVIDDYEVAAIRRAIVFDPDKEPDIIVPSFDDASSLPYRRLIYTLPGAGTVTQFVSNRFINRRAHGPDDLFIQLQDTNLGLQRYPINQTMDGTLNSQFAVNYGMPYGFVVSVNSLPFSSAPDSILQVMGRLTWATDAAARAEGSTALAPNELLALGYFEDMAINYHDDGETTLGPTIASLSLGAKAAKSLRMKYKYYNGFLKSSASKRTLTKDDPILPGCAGRDWRLALKQRYDNKELSQDQYEKLWWETYKAWNDANKEKNKERAKDKNNEVKLLRTRAAEAPPCIVTELQHGDIVVMHGAGVQKYYEHSVVLEKGGGAKLRFALTARHVLPDTIPKAEWPKGEFQLTPAQVYDGQ